MDISFSIIVPVYNRPDEIRELLQSLSLQTSKDFEVVIVEDGSTLTCENVCREYRDKLNLKYFAKPNTGRSDTRNYGMDRASGNYFIFFDSDCVIPPKYIEIIRLNLSTDYVDCFGAPDTDDKSFSNTQRAISYAMTSFFSTGGIRGGKSKNFVPRSFNMGFSKDVYAKVGGFRNMIGEDQDISIRIKDEGFSTALFKNAVVYHKRRVSLKKFYRQTNTFGKGRMVLYKLHRNSLRFMHLMPLFFVGGNILLLVLSFFCLWFLCPIAVYIVAVFFDSLYRNKNIAIAAVSVVAVYTQLFGYGLGLLDEILTSRAWKITHTSLQHCKSNRQINSQEKLYK